MVSDASAVSVQARVVRVAVLGTGSAGLAHLGALRQLAGVEPIAVPRRPERVEELTATGVRASRDLREAVAGGCTAAVIATDTGRHLEDALAALAQGLNVLVEKPMTANAPDAARLRAAAVQAGRRLFVGCTLRFSESLNAFRSRLKDIGRVHAVRVECQSYLPDWRPTRPYQESYAARPSEGGVLLDLIHEIDYTGWLFGWPDAVQARRRNLGRLGIAEDEAVDLVWDTAEAGCVSMSLDYLTRPPRRVMRSCGEGGTLEWDGIARTATLHLVGKAPQRVGSSQTVAEMFAAQASAFLEACRDGQDSRLATAEDGVRALAVCEAARRASERRREEPVVMP